MAEEDTKSLTNFQANQAIVLARLDERTQHIVSNLLDFRTQVDRQITDLKDDANTRYTQLKNDSDKRVDDVKAEIDSKLQSFSDELNSKVSVDSFEPVKLLTYGVAGLLLAAIVTAIAASVLTNDDTPERGRTQHEIIEK